MTLLLPDGSHPNMEFVMTFLYLSDAAPLLASLPRKAVQSLGGTTPSRFPPQPQVARRPPSAVRRFLRSPLFSRVRELVQRD